MKTLPFIGVLLFLVSQNILAENDIKLYWSKDYNKRKCIQIPPDSNYPFLQKEIYRIALALPFELEKVLTEDFKQSGISKLSEDFYSGILLFLDEYSASKSNIKFELFVYDISQYDTLPADFFNKLEKNNIDFLIGPFYKNQFNSLKTYSVNNKIIVLSPFIADEDNLKHNPYFISYRPSENLIKNAIAEHIAQNYNKYNLFLICSNKTELEEINNLIKEKTVNIQFTGYNSAIINASNWSNTTYLNNLKDSNNLFLCTIKNDMVAINSILTNLIGYVDKEIQIIAPYDWLHYPSIETSMLNMFNSGFYTDQFLDFSDTNNFSFIMKYREKYKVEPNDYSFRGYQIIKLIINGVLSEGKFIQRNFTKPNLFTRSGEGLGFQNCKIYFYYFTDNALLKYINKESAK